MTVGRVKSLRPFYPDSGVGSRAQKSEIKRGINPQPGKRGDYVPRSPKKPCAYPGCPRLTDRRFCPEHEKLDRDRYNKYERSPDVNRKYGRAWKRIRDRYAAAHPLCEQCLKEGRLTPVEEVHHILPISQGGTHDASNLMSLCQSCHTKIHHELGDR